MTEDSQVHDIQIEQDPSEDSPAAYHETFKSIIPAALAELVGSIVFVFIACGAAMNQYKTLGMSQIAIALCFGWTIIVVAWSIGHISGGHLNFAVTFAFMVLRKITVLRGLMYFVAQLLGGLIGIAFLKAITPPALAGCYAMNDLGDTVTPFEGFCVEAILTGFLLFVVSAAADSAKSNQTFVPVAIGFAITACHLVALPITGCSINPTRSFASAAAASSVDGCNPWTNHYIFWFGPLLGGTASAVVYHFFFLNNAQKIREQIQGVSDSLSGMYKKTA